MVPEISRAVETSRCRCIRKEQTPPHLRYREDDSVPSSAQIIGASGPQVIVPKEGWVCSAMRLYHIDREGDMIRFGMARRLMMSTLTPDLWYLALPYWISLRKTIHSLPQDFCKQFGRRMFYCAIVIKSPVTLISKIEWHVWERDIGKQVQQT